MEISRRGFVGAGAASAVLLGARGASALGLDTVLSQGAGDLLDTVLPAPDDVTHLLNRISFGISEADLLAIRALGPDVYLQQQLNPAAIDDAAVEAEIAATYYPLTLPDRAALAWYYDRGHPAADLRRATLLRQVKSRRQLLEVMVDFWSNHFNIAVNANNRIARYKVLDDRNVIRRHALGTFPDMLKASAQSPAMLMYLDNTVNRVVGSRYEVNENYARELMELHTLGVDGGYSEADVHEVARCFTGWHFNGELGSFEFKARWHDNDPKQVLGQTIHNPDDGVQDGLQVLEYLAASETTARFISRKLVQRFVDDEPPESLVTRLADIYLGGEQLGDIKQMLLALFGSEEFRASADRKVKLPVNYLASVLRTTDPELRFGDQGYWENLLRPMGHLLLMWPTPDGYPMTADYWANANGLLQRWNYATMMGNGGVKRMSLDTSKFIGDAQTAAQLVDRVSQRILRRALREDHRAALVDYVADGRGGDTVLSDAERRDRVKGLLGVLLASPYLLMQ